MIATASSGPGADDVFPRIRALALALAGLALGDRQRELIDRRLTRAKLDGPGLLDGLLAAVERGEHGARRRFLALVTVNHSAFGRNPHQLDLAAEHALYGARRRGAAWLWSAAAATGEEPYTLAATLFEAFAPEPPAARILATDIDEDALDRARAGIYDARAVAALTEAQRARFTEPRPDGRIAIGRALRGLVELHPHNLIAPPPAAQFDVVLCRNALMYLSPDHRVQVIEHLLAVLLPTGLLLLDPSEHPGRAERWLTQLGPGAYLPRSPRRTS